jgi:uncharacterized protein (TIGR04255 family)
MNTQLHYSRSPLTEAVIDIRAKLPDDVSLDVLAKAQSELETDYPSRRDQIFLEGELSLDPDAPPAIGSRTQLGYIFSSDDGRHVFQARLDGFAFSRLAPYQNWESFRDEARRLWNIYRSITHLEVITRIAVRYINRLDLPLPVNDFKEYLRTAPEISSDLPQGLSGYFMQLQIPQEDMPGMLILNQALAPITTPDTAPIILDIDLFQSEAIPNNENDLWDLFERLRHRKNKIFEACITEKMRELIR